ncbi:MAG TPA: V-type ATPase 116kDa subunit family protein, partial [Kofleriaceae bacterium]
AAIRERATAIAAADGGVLAALRSWCHDALLAQDAEDRAAATARAFVLEGWLPARELASLTRALAAQVGPELVIEEVARDAWQGEDAPVVLANPALFRPFEALTSFLPLPRYGSVDPTPFVAVFFPMLFGVIAGDVGYGLAIAAIAVVLRLASPRARDVARIAGAVAVFTIVFGVLYGELFGDLGERWFGMEPLWFDRQQAVLAFLGLAIALGLVHLVIGLVISAVSHWRGHKREALGRGLTAVVLLLIALALAALLEQVPAVLATPATIAILVALPVIVILEGATALLDMMTLLGHVLSYARVMALGTASVMLAVVANRMYGAFGSAAIGIAFGLVFHLVNLAITLFSPTIQVMRLHFVEFFDTFFEPGGGPYRPLRHWRPS